MTIHKFVVCVGNIPTLSSCNTDWLPFADYGFYGLSCSTRTRNECEFSGEIKREVETNEVSGNLSSTLINSKEHGPFSTLVTFHEGFANGPSPGGEMSARQCQN